MKYEWKFTMPDIAAQIKQRLDMRDICERYGIHVNRAGFCRCVNPSHDDRKPSMKVYHDGAYCFSCGASAPSVIDFAMLYFNISFREACKRLNDDFDLGIEFGVELSEEERERARKAKHERKAQMDLLRKKHEALKQTVVEAWNRWAALDKIRCESQPGSDPFEPYDERYLTAMAELPKAEYALDEAQYNLAEFERDYYGGGEGCLSAKDTGCSSVPH